MLKTLPAWSKHKPFLPGSQRHKARLADIPMHHSRSQQPLVQEASGRKSPIFGIFATLSYEQAVSVQKCTSRCTSQRVMSTVNLASWPQIIVRHASMAEKALMLFGKSPNRCFTDREAQAIWPIEYRGHPTQKITSFFFQMERIVLPTIPFSGASSWTSGVYCWDHDLYQLYDSSWDIYYWWTWSCSRYIYIYI